MDALHVLELLQASYGERHGVCVGHTTSVQTTPFVSAGLIPLWRVYSLQSHFLAVYLHSPHPVMCLLD